MSIKKIEIKGYRSLRHVVWEPGPLNIVIGPNGSGKSNLLGALDLLAKSAGGELAESIIELGGLRSLLWDQTDSQLVLDITGVAFSVGDFRYTLALAPEGIGSEPEAESANYHIAAEKLFGRSNKDPEGDPRVLLGFDYGKVPGGEFLPGFAIARGFNPNEAETLLARSSYDLDEIELELSFIQIYRNLQIDPGGPLRTSAVMQSAQSLEIDGRNLIPFLHVRYESDARFRDGFDSAMQAAFPDFGELEFQKVEDHKIQLRIRWKSLRNSQSAAVLSDGTLRFMWLSSLLLHPQGTIIAIDEPETGLHPRMFSILAELARDAAEHQQVIFTTHSPEFLDAFSKFAPTITVTTCEKGETQLSVVDKDELSRWLKEYSPGALFRSGELEALA